MKYTEGSVITGDKCVNHQIKKCTAVSSSITTDNLSWVCSNEGVKRSLTINRPPPPKPATDHFQNRVLSVLLLTQFRIKILSMYVQSCASVCI